MKKISLLSLAFLSSASLYGMDSTENQKQKTSPSFQEFIKSVDLYKKEQNPANLENVKKLGQSLIGKDLPQNSDGINPLKKPVQNMIKFLEKNKKKEEVLDLYISFLSIFSENDLHDTISKGLENTSDKNPDNLERILRLLEESRKNYPTIDKNHSFLNDIAHEFYQNNIFSKAFELWEQAHKKGQDSLFWICNIATEEKEYLDRAFDIVGQGAQIQNHEPVCTLGEACYESGKLDQAFILWEKALEAKYGKAGYQLSQALLKQHKATKNPELLSKSENALNKARLNGYGAKEGPTRNLLNYHRRDLALAFYDNGEKKKAFALLDQVLSDGLGEGGYYKAKCLLEEYKKNKNKELLEESSQYLELAIKNNFLTQSSYAKNWVAGLQEKLAEAFEENGQITEALAFFRKALENGSETARKKIKTLKSFVKLLPENDNLQSSDEERTRNTETKKKKKKKKKNRNNEGNGSLSSTSSPEKQKPETSLDLFNLWQTQKKEENDKAQETLNLAFEVMLTAKEGPWELYTEWAYRTLDEKEAFNRFEALNCDNADITSPEGIAVSLEEFKKEKLWKDLFSRALMDKKSDLALGCCEKLGENYKLMRHFLNNQDREPMDWNTYQSLLTNYENYLIEIPGSLGTETNNILKLDKEHLQFLYEQHHLNLQKKPLDAVLFLEKWIKKVPECNNLDDAQFLLKHYKKASKESQYRDFTYLEPAKILLEKSQNIDNEEFQDGLAEFLDLLNTKKQNYDLNETTRILKIENDNLKKENNSLKHQIEQNEEKKKSPKAPSKGDLQSSPVKKNQESTRELLKKALAIKLPDWIKKREIMGFQTLGEKAEEMLLDMLISYECYDLEIKEKEIKFLAPSIRYDDICYEVEKLREISGALEIKSPFNKTQYTQDNDILKPDARLFLQNGIAKNLGHLKEDAKNLQGDVIPYDKLWSKTN